jgi:hypothetical protein
MHGSPFGSENPSSSGGGGTRVGGSTSTGVKLRTLTTTNKAIELDDDNSSTQNFADRNYASHNWADAETGSSGSAGEGRRDSDGVAGGEFGVETLQQRSQSQHGVRTWVRTMVSRADGADQMPPDRGIHIKNEMSVSYENA